MTMYPKNAIELAAIIAALVPLFVWAVSGAFSVYARLGENRRADWLRINELIQAVYNKGGQYGHWAQLLSVTELASFRARRDALNPILRQASVFFRSQGSDTAVALADHIDELFGG